MNKSTASQIIESLRKGIPPQRGIQAYSIGHEKLLAGIQRHHLNDLPERGIIRFLSGSWGAGKTHFFRQLRELALENNTLVAQVELHVNEAALNQFERVFHAIVRSIVSPLLDKQGHHSITPFGLVLQESLAWLGTGHREQLVSIEHEAYLRAEQCLMLAPDIDINFKKVILHYWKTFLPQGADPIQQEQQRAEILQWFTGQGNLAFFRRLDVHTLISRALARPMLQSLANFILLAGYQGLLILFDEAEQSYSVMRRSALKEAHNNLLLLLNQIETLPGLFMIYATTPDFYHDPRYGIVTYGALLGRIGKPEKHPPRALENVWNFDAIMFAVEDYQQVAQKMVSLHHVAYPPSEPFAVEDVKGFVTELFEQHPQLSPIRFWRILVTALIGHLDERLEGVVRPTLELYDDIMERLREE